MARKKKQKAEPTEQFNVQLPSRLVRRVRRYANANKFQPSNSQVALAALTAFLDAEGVPDDEDDERDETKPRKPKQEPK